MNLLADHALGPPAPARAAATAVPHPDAGAGELETAVIDMAHERRPAVPAHAEAVETVAMTPTPSGPSSGVFESDSGGRTMPGSLIGTPAYMSPEQALGKPIDYRSDIYSLAVVAYSLVCGELPFSGKAVGLREFHMAGAPAPPASVCKVPGDVSDAVLAGLARDPAGRPSSAVAFTRRFRNAVDAEFLALRRSKAFLLQHLGSYALLIAPMYGSLIAMAALLPFLGGKLLPFAAVRMVLVPLAAAVLFVFFDNVLRTAAALMALDERFRVRRFQAFRVFWRLLRRIPALAVTQAAAVFSFGPRWVTGDCLWPVVCAVEGLTGKRAVERSRELMTGLRSAGRALAIRHLALAAFPVFGLARSIVLVWRTGPAEPAGAIGPALWFPVFALFAAAPLFLYDRTAAQEAGPLLQLDRTPELRVTSRPLSLASMGWLIAGALYLLYQPLKFWLFGG
jgi:hypothetical protein